MNRRRHNKNCGFRIRRTKCCTRNLAVGFCLSICVFVTPTPFAQTAVEPISRAQVEKAVDQIDGLVQVALESTGIPGLAIAEKPEKPGRVKARTATSHTLPGYT